MTLVSFTTNYGRPILIADLLTTANTRGKATQIPTFQTDVEADLPEGQQSFPFELKQKIYIIKEQIALGLAGNVHQMTNYLKDIKNYFNYHLPTDENFNKFMDNYDAESIDECSIVVFIVELVNDGISPTIYHYGEWEEYNDPLVQCGLITGTGKKTFFRNLSSLNAGEDKEDRSRNINLNLLSLFIAEERYTMDSIVDSWGAGFEVIEYIDGKFKKLDDLTYIICHSEVDEKGTLNNYPFLIMHYTYHGDILTINTYLESEFKRYVVLPLDLKKEELAPEAIPEYNGFQSFQVICAFVIEKDNGGFFFTSVLTNPGDGHDAISVKFDPPAPAYLEVRIDEFISHKIVEEYKKILHN